MRKALVLIAVSLALVGCTKTYPTSVINNYIQDTTRNSMGIKNPVTVYVQYSSSIISVSSQLRIFADGQLITTSTTLSYSDSITVPDSAYLYARWGTNHADTIASPGMTWNIH